MYVVYLLHLERPLHWGAQHYLGYSKNLEARLELHQGGQGASFLRYAVHRGIPFHLTRQWQPAASSEACMKWSDIK